MTIAYKLTALGGLRRVDTFDTPAMRREVWREKSSPTGLEVVYETRLVEGVERKCMVRTTLLGEEGGR